MDKARYARYFSKIRFIMDSLVKVQSGLPNPNELEERGIYYCIQTSIETSMDLIAMMLKDLGIVPQGDRENIEKLVEIEYIIPQTANALRQCNGLRNVLVHRYNGINRDLVFHALPEVEQVLKKLLKLIEGFLSESS